MYVHILKTNQGLQGMMLVSQGIVWYDMVYITHACMTQCYGTYCQYVMLWYVIVCQYGMMLVSQGNVGYVIVSQYGMMLVSQGIVGYDMVYITHACMTQCYGPYCQYVMLWYMLLYVSMV